MSPKPIVFVVANNLKKGFGFRTLFLSNKVNLPSSQKLNIQLLQSIKPTQAHALNTGIKKTDADYVSFLEDDDYWQPHFLETSLKSLKTLLNKNKFGIISSNQLEINSAKDLS